LPWAVSRLGVRHGWSDGRPGVGNWVGLVLVTLGTAGLMWVLGTGLANWGRMPKRAELGLRPPYLVTSGAYAITRHPIYASVLMLWLGWAIFYGSGAVLIGFAIIVVVVCVVVPREEKALERYFGEEYRRYKARVGRGIRITR